MDDTEWYKLALNPQAITQLYTIAPTLNELELCEISFTRDGPPLHIRADLAQFPERPPQRWVIEGCNTVQIHLDFYELLSVELRGWAYDNFGTIRIAPTDYGHISLAVESSTCTLRAEFAFFRIAQLSGYIKLPE